jgi:hypothetical protein
VNVLQQAAQDRRGRLWKARDRLVGAVRTHGTDQRVLDALGQVHWDMGDAPAAGAAWFLTDRSDDEATLARDAFAERHGYTPAHMISALPRRGEVETYPVGVQLRLQQLIDDAARDGFTYKPSSSEVADDDDAAAPESMRSRIAEGLAVTTVLALTVGVWFAGVIGILVTLF